MNMQILIVGSGLYRIYEQSLKSGFEFYNHNVDTHYYKSFFVGENTLLDLINRFQNKFLIGPSVLIINLFLILRVAIKKYSMVFIYRGTHISHLTVLILARFTTVYGYNNDDPFGMSMPKYYWRKFNKSIKYYHHIFSYRPSNISQYYDHGAVSVSLLMSSYDKQYNFKIDNLLNTSYLCDLVFIGHFENDGRDKVLIELIRAGFDIRVYGGIETWSQSLFFEEINRNNKIQLIVEDYNLAINSAKIALNFLSKVNNDVYTRRCFEIPVTGTVLMSEYSSFLEEIFENDNEIVMFKTIEELKNKAKFLLNNPEELNRISERGMRKVREQHSNLNRCFQILKLHESLRVNE